MKRAQALESIGLGGWLVLGLFVAQGEAGPYLTHRAAEAARRTEPIDLPSCSSLPVAGCSPGPGRAHPLDLNFEPGIGNSLEAPLPPPLAGDAERPTTSLPPGHELEPRAASAPVPPRQAVPEPASIVLVVTGLIGLAARRHLLRNRI
jgi:hypothetical protein